MKDSGKRPVGQPTRPYGMACMICRRMKIKCINTGLQPNRCDRCIKLDKVCHFEPQRRRLTRLDESANRPFLPLQSHGSHTESSPRRHQAESPLLEFQQFGESSRTLHPQSSNQPKDLQEENLGGDLFDDTISRASSAPNTTGESSQLPFASAQRPLHGPPEVATSSSGREWDSVLDGGSSMESDDPIDNHIVDWDSAVSLFDGYFGNFEYHVGFLDPELYTLEYARESSALLFTTILTTAARLFRPDRYRFLKAHQEKLLGRALLACDSSPQTIWAIVLGFYYKELGDTRGCTLVGFATRLATSSGWDHFRQNTGSGRSQKSSGPQNPQDVRIRRDQERAWLFLGSLDRSLSIFTNKPIMTTLNENEQACRAWVGQGGPYTYAYGDIRAIACLELTILAKPGHDFLHSARDARGTDLQDANQSNATLVSILAKFNRDVTAWGDYWAPRFRDCETGTRCRASQVYLYRDYLRTHFHSVLLSRLLAASGNDMRAPAALGTAQMCYTASISFLQETVRLGQMNVLYYLWDTCHFMVSSSAMALLKVIKQAPCEPGISVMAAYEALNSAADAISRASESCAAHESLSIDEDLVRPTKSTLDAQLRLLRAIVFRVRTESLPPRGDLFRNHSSPAVSSMAHGVSTDMSGDAPPDLDTPMQFNISESSIQPPDSRGEFDQGGAEMEHAYDVAGVNTDHLAFEMDYFLDSSFTDSLLVDTDIRALDEPGMFYRPM